MRRKIDGDGIDFIAIGPGAATALGRTLDFAAVTPFEYQGRHYKSIFAFLICQHALNEDIPLVTPGNRTGVVLPELYGVRATYAWSILSPSVKARLRPLLQEAWMWMAVQHRIGNSQESLVKLVAESKLPYQWIEDLDTQTLSPLPSWIESVFNKT